MREAVIEAVPSPSPPGHVDAQEYLRRVDEAYRSDAYHSLSIEGYEVTPELVEQVRSGAWDPEASSRDADLRDALAARGYWQAFQSVKRSVSAGLEGEKPGATVRSAHREWYRELLEPFVPTGVLGAATLAGYRSSPVYIRGSRHVPPRPEAVTDASTDADLRLFATFVGECVRGALEES